MSKRNRNRSKAVAAQIAPIPPLVGAPGAGAFSLYPAAADAMPRHIVASKQEISVSYSGPVPAPWVLKQYNDLVPGSAERILAQAEQQTTHRIALENKVTSSSIHRSYLGLAAGFVVAMTAIIGGISLVAFGHDAAGTTIAGLATSGLVGVFVYGKVSQSKERKQRVELMTQAPKESHPGQSLAKP